MNVKVCDFDGHIVSVQCTLSIRVRGGNMEEPVDIPLILQCKSDDTGMMSSYSVSLCNANLEQWKIWESIAEQKKDYIKAILFTTYQSKLRQYETTAPPFVIK